MVDDGETDVVLLDDDDAGALCSLLLGCTFTLNPPATTCEQHVLNTSQYELLMRTPPDADDDAA